MRRLARSPVVAIGISRVFTFIGSANSVAAIDIDIDIADAGKITI